MRSTKVCAFCGEPAPVFIQRQGKAGTAKWICGSDPCWKKWWRLVDEKKR